jgi:hypothetical protein
MSHAAGAIKINTSVPIKCRYVGNPAIVLLSAAIPVGGIYWGQEDELEQIKPEAGCYFLTSARYIRPLIGRFANCRSALGV